MATVVNQYVMHLMIRYLYTLLLYLLTPWLFLRLWWKGRQYRAYRERWQERFGFFPAQNQPCIWLHAVSYGESVAAETLIKKIQQQYPDYLVAVTTMTPTGSERIRQSFGESVFNIYIPYDLPNAVKRFLRRLNPKIGIIMETELWPNLLHFTALQRIPLLLANARLSEKSFRGYRHITALTRSMLSKLHLIAAQTEPDATRFQQLGAKADKVQVTGSIKFDYTPPKDQILEGHALRQCWDLQRPIWIAASTHPGEEALVLQAFHLIRQHVPELLLLLVPRHPERFKSVKKLCQQQFNVICRSDGKPCTANTDIFLGDSMGEMFIFYAAADVAFVGGSLVPIGGHNLLEPAALKLPLLTGPHLHHFSEISAMFSQAGALSIANNVNELAALTTQLFLDEAKVKKVGAQAYQVLENNRGALKHHLKWVENQLRHQT